MSHYTQQNKRKKKINITQNLNYTIKGENILPDLRACSKPSGREEIQYKCRKNISQLLQKALSFPTCHKCLFSNRNCPIQLHSFLFSSSIKKKKKCWPDYLFGRPFQSQTVSKLLPFPRFL